MASEKAPEPEERIPITSPGLRIGKSSAIILVQFALAAYITILINYWYWNELVLSLRSGQWWLQWWLWILFPLSIMGTLFMFPFIVLLLTKVIVSFSFRSHPPTEGVFPVDGPEHKAWVFRQHAMLFAIWLARRVPLPWIDMAFFKILGVGVGGNPVLYDSWVDTELVKFGGDNMLSLNAIVMTHMITPGNPRKFLVKGISTADYCIIGAESVAAPGTILEKGAIFGANSCTAVGAHLEADWIYGGNPAKKIMQSSGVLALEEKEMKGQKTAQAAKQEEQGPKGGA